MTILLNRLMHHAMSEPDDGSGNGEAAPQSQPQPQAQGADNSDLMSQISDLMDSKLSQQSDAFHANMRRQIDTRLGKKASKEPAQAPRQEESQSDPRVDVREILKRERELGSAVAGFDISEGARNRMQSAFDRENPENVSEWASSWAADFGFGKSGTVAPIESTDPATPPVTGSGAAAAPPNYSESTPLHKMAEADQQALLKEKGAAWYTAKFREGMRGTKIKVRNI